MRDDSPYGGETLCQPYIVDSITKNSNHIFSTRDDITRSEGKKVSELYG